MEKPLEEKGNSLPGFTHSTDLIPLNFGQNSDGFEILVRNLFCRPLTKKENGLP
jgi:hypothetical protein